MELQLTMTQIASIATTRNLGDILDLLLRVGGDSYESIMETDKDDLFQETGRGSKTKINFTLLKKYMVAAVDDIKATAVAGQIASGWAEAQRIVLANEDAIRETQEARRLADIAAATTLKQNAFASGRSSPCEPTDSARAPLREPTQLRESYTAQVINRSPMCLGPTSSKHGPTTLH